MRLRNVKGSREKISSYVSAINMDEHETSEYKGRWNILFGNDNPIHIEIGMGKGQFITTLAMNNPDINYIGIEKFSSVMVRAIEKKDMLENEKNISLNNLIFLRMDATIIDEVFEKDEVSKIYLNFSDPWPKDRHAKRRLTSRTFFGRYEKFLKDDGSVEFKTDNKDLFDFSLEEVKETNFYIDAYTFDLHREGEALNKGNIMTEYEEKFVEKGNKICKLVARKNR
ncbi:tRNA (guanine-N7-)-methyltransferase [Lachnospiraceae bacterium RM5]|nr:tRNA (guanine-N7-)-methyltransferase [Lachnospiraceae bacterium RM5]